jgi:uncharacterized membrane protein
VPSGAKLLVAATAVLAAGLLVAGNAGAQGAAKAVGTCEEKEGTPPSGPNAKNLIELQANKARPTFDVGLADKSAGKDNISFSPKAGERIGNRVAAEVVDTPRAGEHPLRAEILIAAHPSKSGRAVVVEACFRNVDHWYAGSYAGTIRVYGPRLTDFNYALVVTTKWPWWVAILVIGATVLFSVLVFVLLPRVPNPKLKRDREEWRAWLALVLGIVVGALLAGLTYWSLYEANDTWGSDPQAQVLALVMASFSATVVGYGAVASAQRQIDPSGTIEQTGDSENRPKRS